jgi:hypothetical protein
MMLKLAAITFTYKGFLMNIYTASELNQYLNIAHTEFNRCSSTSTRIKKLKFHELICQSLDFKSKNSIINKLKEKHIIIPSVVFRTHQPYKVFCEKVLKTYQIKFEDDNFFTRISNIFLKQLFNSPQKGFYSKILDHEKYNFDNGYGYNIENDCRQEYEYINPEKEEYFKKRHYFFYELKDMEYDSEERIECLASEYSVLINKYDYDPLAIKDYIAEIFLTLLNNEKHVHRLRDLYPLAKYTAQYWLNYFEKVIGKYPMEESFIRFFGVVRHAAYQMGDEDFSDLVCEKATAFKDA